MGTQIPPLSSGNTGGASQTESSNGPTNDQNTQSSFSLNKKNVSTDEGKETKKGKDDDKKTDKDATVTQQSPSDKKTVDGKLSDKQVSTEGGKEQKVEKKSKEKKGDDDSSSDQTLGSGQSNTSQGSSKVDTNVDSSGNTSTIGVGAKAIQATQANMSALTDAISNNVKSLAVGPTGAIATLGGKDIPSCFQGCQMQLDKGQGVLAFGNMSAADAQTAKDMMSQNPDMAAKMQLFQTLQNNGINSVQFGNGPAIPIQQALGIQEASASDAGGGEQEQGGSDEGDTGGGGGGGGQSGGEET